MDTNGTVNGSSSTAGNETFVLSSTYNFTFFSGLPLLGLWFGVALLCFLIRLAVDHCSPQQCSGTAAEDPASERRRCRWQLADLKFLFSVVNGTLAAAVFFAAVMLPIWALLGSQASLTIFLILPRVVFRRLGGA